MTPQEYVQQKAAASGSSFYYAFLFLPPARRQAISAFYAFCREVDDIVDEVSESNVAHAKLAWWRQEVTQAFAGQPQHPVMQALMPGAQEFGLNASQLLAVIEGCQMDLSQTRYLDRVALERYAHLVAGVVGEVSARIFGQTDDGTTAYAHRLGLAFQWTNILRDVGEDARAGRLYLPQAWMREAGIDPQTWLATPSYSTALATVVKRLLKHADRLYDEHLATLRNEGLI